MLILINDQFLNSIKVKLLVFKIAILNRIVVPTEISIENKTQ